jgi:hypothetical protein
MSALKRPVAGLEKEGKRCKSVAGREPTSEGEKSWQAAGYVKAEVTEERRNIWGRPRAGECARTCAAWWTTQICHHVGEASFLLFIYFLFNNLFFIYSVSFYLSILYFYFLI